MANDRRAVWAYTGNFRMQGSSPDRLVRVAALMELNLYYLLSAGVVLFFSCLIQSTVGFAAGLFGIPLMVLIGLSVPQAIAFSLMASVAQTMWGAYQLRDSYDRSETTVPILLRIISLPLGAYCLYLIGTMHQAQMKQFIGFVLLFILIVQRLWRVPPRDQLSPVWMYVAFPISGFMAGLVGMGGPAMVLWVMAHTWSPAKSRGFLFYTFSVCTPLQLGMMLYGWGWEVGIALLLGLALIPMTIAGTIVGMRIGNRLPRARLRQLTLALLAMIAFSAILAPLARHENREERVESREETRGRT